MTSHDYLELLISLVYRRRYESLFSNPQKLARTGEMLKVNLVSVEPWSIEGIFATTPNSYLTRISGMGVEGVGIGASSVKSVAIQKSISEAYERLAFQLVGRLHGLRTSNGIAAHPSYASACENAAQEALERDALLVHWLQQIPFRSIEMNQSISPSRQFSVVQMLLSECGYISTLTLIAKMPRTKVALVAHGTGPTLLKAYLRAHAELERLARPTVEALKFGEIGLNLIQDQIWQKAIFLESKRPLPSWMFGQSISWKRAARAWKATTQKLVREFEFVPLAKGALHVVHANHSGLQSLFFQSTENAVDEGLINFGRLETKNINREPHFVA